MAAKMTKEKLEQLKIKLQLAEEKYKKAREQFQIDCKHKVERWSDYGGINEQCIICDKWFR